MLSYAVPTQADNAMLCSTPLSNMRQQPPHCNAGDLRSSQGLGLHTASTSSLQYAYEDGVNGIAAMPHPAHVRTSSVADSGDETAGELLTAVSSCVH